MLLDDCRPFWSESFWAGHVGLRPPGLMGSSTGIGLGRDDLGPVDRAVDPASVAYARKDFSGWWGDERR